MASQPRWSRTVGGPLDSEAPWLALRLRREYSFDNRDLGLKVRMGPGRKLPVKRVWYFARFNGQAGPNRRAAMAAHAAGA